MFGKGGCCQFLISHLNLHFSFSVSLYFVLLSVVCKQRESGCVEEESGMMLVRYYEDNVCVFYMS